MSEVPINFVSDIVFFDDEKGAYKDGSFFRDDMQAGSASYLSDSENNSHSSLIYICPCGCGNVSSIPIATEQKDERRAWLWDGNIFNPSLIPSIQKTSPCHWHGYLTNGIFRSC